eukprot:TRINITY_DN8721_c0_g2_i1.p1 TRINITY_DN8721_c0_g2~~TRINITY_DN8721_c0_g2_i1.p1  ORF type:complete len:618 (+),score=123.51 TRINITY_DN8721_c0_g2_i1:249-1856(+)
MFQREAMTLGEPFEEHAILCNWRNGYCASMVRWGGLTQDEQHVYGAMVEDVWRTGYEYGRGKHLVYTNYDIILKEDFYVRLADMFRQDNKLRFVDNFRQDLIVPVGTPIDHWQVEDIFAWPTLGEHPGHDCFVLPRAWVPCLDLANFMMGMGYWGVAIKRQLVQMLDQFGFHGLIGTFRLTRHLGRRTLSGLEYIGSGKDWQEGHEQQMKHNHWQYTKVFFRMKHEMSVYQTNINQGKHSSWSATADALLRIDASITPTPCAKVPFVQIEQPSWMTYIYGLPGVDQALSRRVLELSTGLTTGSARPQPALGHVFARDTCGDKMVANFVDGRLTSASTLLNEYFTSVCDRCQSELPRRILVVLDHPYIMLWELALRQATVGNFADLTLPMELDKVTGVLERDGPKLAEDIVRRLADIVALQAQVKQEQLHVISLADMHHGRVQLDGVLDWIGTFKQMDEERRSCLDNQWDAVSPEQQLFNQYMLPPKDHQSATRRSHSLTRRDIIKHVSNHLNDACRLVGSIDEALITLGVAASCN